MLSFPPYKNHIPLMINSISVFKKNCFCALNWGRGDDEVCFAGIVSRVMSKVACSLGYGSGWGKVADRVLVK
jgi:hypothetical protein